MKNNAQQLIRESIWEEYTMSYLLTNGVAGIIVAVTCQKLLFATDLDLVLLVSVLGWMVFSAVFGRLNDRIFNHALEAYETAGFIEYDEYNCRESYREVLRKEKNSLNTLPILEFLFFPLAPIIGHYRRVKLNKVNIQLCGYTDEVEAEVMDMSRGRNVGSALCALVMLMSGVFFMLGLPGNFVAAEHRRSANNKARFTIQAANSAAIDMDEKGAVDLEAYLADITTVQQANVDGELKNYHVLTGNLEYSNYEKGSLQYRMAQYFCEGERCQYALLYDEKRGHISTEPVAAIFYEGDITSEMLETAYEVEQKENDYCIYDTFSGKKYLGLMLNTTNK